MSCATRAKPLYSRAMNRMQAHTPSLRARLALAGLLLRP
jgi:hypothetical protein